MARYRTTIESTRSAEEAFAYLAQFDRCREWDPSVERAEALEHAPGPDARFLVVSRFLGREIPLEYRITTWEPPNRLELRAENGSVRSHDQIFVTATPTGSSVTYDADLRGTGILGRLIEPVLAVAFRHLAGRAADGLRRELNR